MLRRIATGFIVAFSVSATAIAHDGPHPEKSLEVDAENAPRIVDLRVEKNPVAGFNLLVVTENFEFAPEQVNQAHADNKGHGHIYVDGVKIARIYAPAHHLDGLQPGERRIEVTLNANDHREYSVGGSKISAAATIAVP